jgi:hypothetical protein
MHRAADNRLVDVDVTIPYLEVEATIGVSAYPRFIVNWRALTAEVRERHQIACIALLALGHTELLHKTTSHLKSTNSISHREALVQFGMSAREHQDITVTSLGK